MLEPEERLFLGTYWYLMVTTYPLYVHSTDYHGVDKPRSAMGNTTVYLFQLAIIHVDLTKDTGDWRSNEERLWSNR